MITKVAIVVVKVVDTCSIYVQ